MAVVRVNGLKALPGVLRRDMKARDARIRQALRRVAVQGAAVMRRHVPVAHSDLRDSVHADGTKIKADAPHAAAVNNGSRPHMPPLEPIIKWVKLRGAQGLASDKQLGRLPGKSTAGHAKSVAAQIRALQNAPTKVGRHTQEGASTPVDAAEQVAWAIALAIKKHGTKAHHYLEASVPEMMRILDRELSAALADKT